MKRYYQLVLGITMVLIMLFSSGCYGPTHYDNGSYSGISSINVVTIRPQPIPVVDNRAFGRQPGYTLVELTPGRRIRLDDRRSRSKDQSIIQNITNPPELDYGGSSGGGSSGGGASGGGASGGGASGGGGG